MTTDLYPSVPAEMKALKNWVKWRMEPDPDTGKPTKVPYQLSGDKAASNNPFTWCAFDKVSGIKAVPNTGGIGFVAERSTGLVLIDLDDCFTPDDNLDPQFARIVDAMHSYKEVSQSGTGLHIVIRCPDFPYGSGKNKRFVKGEKQGVEIYCETKYFCTTGELWGDYKDITTYDGAFVKEIFDPYFKDDDSHQENISIAPVPLTSLSDSDVLNAAYLSDSGQKIKDLMDGNTGTYPSPSEADGALAMHLSWWCNKNSSQIERIMRSSRLYRNKWDKHKTYLKGTIETANSKVKGGYLPGYAGKLKPVDAAASKPGVNDPITPSLPTITDEEIAAIRDQRAKSFPELPELQDGFFKDYMEYGRQMNYAYPAYHFGTMLAFVSMMVGRKMVMQSSAAKFYCNVFVMVIGQTTTSGKSTACNEMINNFFPSIQRPLDKPEDPKEDIPDYVRMNAVDFLPVKNSPQSFIERMTHIPTRLWYIDECAEFFDDTTSQWAETLISNVCRAYDGGAFSYGLGKGKNKIDEYKTHSTFLSCLWNTTCSEIEAKVQQKLASNGFLLRWMWFWCHKNTEEPRKSRPLNREDMDARAKLSKVIHRLGRALNDPRSKFTSSHPEDRIIFEPSDKIETWKMEDLMGHTDSTAEHENHRQATSRLVPQCYKIAMLMSVVDDRILSQIEKMEVAPLNCKIPDDIAELAIQICEVFLRPRLRHVMYLAQSNDAKNLQTQVIKSLLKHNGIASKSQIQRDTRINARNFNETITSMIDSEQVQIFTSPTGKPGRTGEIVKYLQ